MPTVTENRNHSYYRYEQRYECKPWTNTSWIGGTSVAFRETSNDPQSRPYPDPLTDTALSLQSRMRTKVSKAHHQIGTITDFSCVPARAVPRWRRAEGVAENTPVFLPYSLDWESKFLQKIADQYTNIGDSLAEYRTTASEFARYAQGVRNGWLAFRGRKSLKWKPTPCDIPAAELAYSFGIAPLAEDLFSSAEALRLKLNTPLFVPVHVTTTAHSRGSPVIPGYSDVSKRQTVSVRAEAEVKIVPSRFANLAFGNPVSWAWELIPFSFVVDWGIPIGQWLQDLDMIRRIEGVKGTVSTKRRYVSYWRVNNTQSGITYGLGNIGKCTYKDHSRSILTTIPVPNLPRWKPSLSWHKVYRAMTLLIAVNQPCRKYSGRRR